MVKLFRLALWIGILTGGLSSVWGAEVPVLEIPDRITVPGPEIYLSDLGTIHNATKTELNQLKIDLGPAPYPGQIRVFTQDYLAVILKQRGFKQALDIRMGKQVEVRVESTCITGAQLEEAIRKLLPETDSYLVKIWVELKNLPRETWLSKGDWKVEASPLGELPRAGNILFRVTLSKGSEVKTINVSGKIRAIGRVYRSIRDINRHSLINNIDFEMIETELTSGEEVLGEFPQLARSIKVIKKGEILRTGFYQPLPLVTKETPVNVFVKGDSITVKMTGIAKMDGWLGDQVTILNPTSGKMFRGRVTGQNQVEVNF